jgi:hypothetical protein
MKPQPDVEFAAFVGIDWSDTKHDICLQAAGSEEREFAILADRPAVIEARVVALRQRFGGRPVAPTFWLYWLATCRQQELDP